jgi:hypothetical protein
MAELVHHNRSMPIPNGYVVLYYTMDEEAKYSISARVNLQNYTI